MKINLKFGSGRPGRGAAMVALVLGGYTSVCPAQNIINDFGGTPSGAALSQPSYIAQGFQATAGPITAAALVLYFDTAWATAGSPLDVYIYNATSSGTPTTAVGTLGTITPVAADANRNLLYSVNIASSITLVNAQDYALVIEDRSGTAVVQWDYVTPYSIGMTTAVGINSANGATGNILYSWYNTTTSPSTWLEETASHPGEFAMQTEIVSAPEPSTTAFLGLGGLTLIFIQRLRRKSS